jgi:hypothetical protein
MNDKPKDRTTMWMSIIAIILALMIAFTLGVEIHKIVTDYHTIFIVGLLLYLVFIAIVLRWIMREKRTYKPKDRTTMRMSIIAIILVLIITLRVQITLIVIGGGGIGGVFILLCLAFLGVALHWKAVGGVFFMIMGLLVVYSEVEDIIQGSYETFSEVIFGFVEGLLPLIIGLLFLAIWRRRKAKVPTGSD